MNYFAYGSNMNHEQMRKRCPGGVFIAPARLEGHTLVFDGSSKERNGAVANIVPGSGEVWGGLYEITEEDLASLDEREGYPHCYDRTIVIVSLEDGGTREAIAYYRTPRVKGEPSPEYLATIVQGARDCGLPAAYCDALAL